MSLTLEEIRSLVSALGVQIPDLILMQRQQAEQFAARRTKIAAEGGQKPEDWRLKANFEDVLNRASESADQKQFVAALQLLDEVEQILQQPDAPPAPEPPVAAAPDVAAQETMAPARPAPEAAAFETTAEPPASEPAAAAVPEVASQENTVPATAAPQSSASEAVPEPPPTAPAAPEEPATPEVVSSEPAAAEAPSPEVVPTETSSAEPALADAGLLPADGLLAKWLAAKERVDEQVLRLGGALRETKDPACQRIADMGLNGITGNLQVGLRVALTECDRAGGNDPELNAKAGAIVTQYQEFLKTNKIIDLCDENPFGVQCEIRGTLLEALAELEGSFKS